MRILHTMLRVGNMQRAIDFYTQVLGMQLLRMTERPTQNYDLAHQFLRVSREQQRTGLQQRSFRERTVQSERSRVHLSLG